MKSTVVAGGLIIMLSLFSTGCKKQETPSDMNILFLHHSTGEVIWNGDASTRLGEIAGRYSRRLGKLFGAKAELPELFKTYNKENGKNYRITESFFPKASPYGWNNYPFDYYNIWVKNAGEAPFMEEPTLEMLSRNNQVIIFKHCFPSSNIEADKDSADVGSEFKSLSNYKAQYIALREKLLTFPGTKFIVFTGAVQVKAFLTEEQASRAKEFNKWVIEEWDMEGDNIYLWDLYALQTEGGLYFKDEYAVSSKDSHPNKEFAGKVVKLLFNRVVDIIENGGKTTDLTGQAI